MRSSSKMSVAFAVLSSVFLAGLSPTSSFDKNRVETYSEVGPWRVLAISNRRLSKGIQDAKHVACSAYYEIDSGLGRLFVVTFSKASNGEWKIELRNETWPIRSQAEFAGSLVDLKTNEKISTGTSYHRDKSLTFVIGSSAEEIRKFQKDDKLYLGVNSPALNSKLEIPNTKAVIDRINSCHNEKEQ